MSHYPSSAELAAFRRSILPSWFAAYEHGYRDMAGRIVAANGTMKQYGCPVQNGRHHIATITRREASAMRSRAYDRAARDCDAAYSLPLLDMLNPDGSYFGPWYEELSYGVPYIFDTCERCAQPHTYCPCYLPA